MSISKNRNLAWTSAVATSTTAFFMPSGGWELASGVTSGKSWGEMRGHNGQFVVQAAVQLANDVRSPDSATPIGNAMSTDGMSDPGVANISTDGKTYLRTGWLISLATGSTMASASFGGMIQLRY